MKKQSRAHGSSTKHKTVKIRPKHNKAYRKRHFLLLTTSLAGLLLLCIYLLQYNSIAQTQTKNAQSYITENTLTNDAQHQTVNSTYGFGFVYNPSIFYGSAIDTTSGGLYIGSELNTTRAYEVIKLSSNSLGQPQNLSTVAITYHNEMVVNAANVDYSSLEKQLVEKRRISDGVNYTKKSSSNIQLGGKKFVRTIWVKDLASETNLNLSSAFVSYTGVINGRPLVIEVSTRLSSPEKISSDTQNILDSMQFGSSLQAGTTPRATAVAAKLRSLSLIDKLTFTGVAAAATDNQVGVAEKISSLYGPATVKVYNAYCMDISAAGKPYLRNACQALTGSAFLVSSDGYLVTNGHVAARSPKEIVINDSLTTLQNGDSRYFLYLTKLAKINTNDPAYTKMTKTKLLATLIDKFYAIPDSTFTKTNDVSNLMIGLNEKQPNVNEWLADTKKRKEYPDQSSIKHATLIASNYRAFDGYDGFRSSDVAILKLAGSNYPTVQLGSISDVSQGSGLNILGYPGNASNNGVTDSTESKATLTTGKVSSIKKASGGKQTLIETDTTIGHGNSGGPAFDDNGDVVGIATYTVDGSGSGNGTYNYIRDIKDAQDLASKNSIAFVTGSKTQDEWEKAIGYFYTSHYSKALGHFETVKKLYPQHPTVDSFMSTSKTRIANGQDIKDFPVAAFTVGVVVLIIVAGGAIFVIIRHKKTHNIYRHQVMQNGMQPVTQGSPPAVTTYDPSQYGRMGQPSMNAPQQTPKTYGPQQTQQAPLGTYISPVSTSQQPPANPSLQYAQTTQQSPMQPPAVTPRPQVISPQQPVVIQPAVETDSSRIQQL